MQARTERFELRADESFFDRIDGWRAAQSDIPSRAEAMRRLIEKGLVDKGVAERPRANDAERLSLLLLLDIVKHLKVKTEFDPKFIEAALMGGHLWGLRWEYPGVFHGHEDREETVSEVVAILHMWSVLEHGLAKLSKKAKDEVEASVGYKVKFSGFDGNNEASHLSAALFLIDGMGRFPEFKGRYLNSHAPLIESYRRMLSEFQPLLSTLHGGSLTSANIVDIVKAQTHPSNRRRSEN